MCTAICFHHDHHFFGRNLDLNYNLPVSVVVVPRRYPILFKALDTLTEHHAIYGVGMPQKDYPFFFDCVNECGLGFAGLNFPGFAHFFPKEEGKTNLAPYELPLYLLGKFKTVKEVKEALKDIVIADLPFSDKLPLATLHYIISDKEEAIVIEQEKDGLHVYDNPYGVLTNNPPFSYHQFNLNNYMNITNEDPTNRFSKDLPLYPYGKAMGAIGLPGDSSPASRFVKETFLLHNVTMFDTPLENVTQAFHLLNSVSTLHGECKQPDGSFEYTIYSSIYDADQKELYLKTYKNSALQRYTLTDKERDSEGIIIHKVFEKEMVQEIG